MNKNQELNCRDSESHIPVTSDTTENPSYISSANVIGGPSQASSVALSQHITTTCDQEDEFQNITACDTFEPGQILLATIKHVRNEGIWVEMPQGRGSGIVLSRRWGTKEARIKAIAKFSPGDVLKVFVLSYDAEHRLLKLELLDENWSPCVSAQLSYTSKPPVKAIAGERILLWDVANLFKKIGSTQAAYVLDRISTEVAVQGYQAIFCMSKNAFSRAHSEQESKSEKESLWEFFQRDDVMRLRTYQYNVGQVKAENPLLQMMQAMPGTICVSNNPFCEDVEMYSGIVGTSRIRPFICVYLNGDLFLSAVGLSRSIKIEGRREPVTVDLDEKTRVQRKANRHNGRTPAFGTYASMMHSELLEHADYLRTHGEKAKAAKLYARIAKENPDAYEALSEMAFEDSDKKKAKVFEALAHKVRKARNRRFSRHSPRND